jgi:hypothetical protein
MRQKLLQYGKRPDRGAAGGDVGPPVLLEGEDLAHYERCSPKSQPNRGFGRSRHGRDAGATRRWDTRDPQTEPSVLRGCGIGSSRGAKFDHDLTAKWRPLRGENH